MSPYKLLNSYDFLNRIKGQDPSHLMVSFDVVSLFTQLPLKETIDIIISRLFPNHDTIYHGFNSCDFRKALELCTCDSYFYFNGDVFRQLDGVAMGLPLGPFC